MSESTGLQASPARETTQEAEEFFRSRLADVDEPTAPFGLIDVRGEGDQIDQAQRTVEGALAKRARALARELGVNAATVFHVVWALVVARCSGRDDVVFGSVVSGRLQKGERAERSSEMFANPLPLRVKLASVSARQLVKRTHEELMELLDHAQASLALAQRCSAVGVDTPLFSAILSYRHSALNAVKVGPPRTNYPCSLLVEDLDEEFSITVQTQSGVDPHRVSSYVHTALESLVQALEESPERAALELAVLPPSERREVLEGFNATQAEYASGSLIHELIEAQVRKRPQAIAVVYEADQLTYEQLNERANQLAHYLRQQGVGPDQLVGICVERSLEMVVGLVGILKAGGAYVPLDPSYPVERLEYMLKDASPPVVLTQARLKSVLPQRGAKLVALDSDWDEIAQHSARDIAARALGLSTNHLAYVIYTSGSTGQPKGAANEHRGVVNRLQWMQDQYRLDADERVLQKTPYSFDVSVWEFFWPLLNGASLIVARPDGHRDPQYLSSLIEKQRVTRVHFVPSALQSFIGAGVAERCGTLRQVVCSGEELPPKLLRECLECLPQVLLSNLYGPTEAAVDVTYWDCRAAQELARVPIGRPISNTQIYILDAHGEPVPIGVTGELYIGGVGVARGYLNRAKLTAERFLKDPFSADATARMYRTGDLARWRADGNIEYLGRNDHQVKLRGFRIELGEIEAQLAAHPQVRAVVLLAREDEPGQKRLVAYFVPRDARSSPSVEELRTHLRERLPEYMVPSAFVLLERLPLTPNGKLDRRALTPPQTEAYATHEYEAPQGEVEEILAGIWQELLKVERVGRHDSFFDLGGHSLLAMKTVTRIAERMAINVSIVSLFKYPTLAIFAEYVELLRPSSARGASLPRSSGSDGTHSSDTAEVVLSRARNRGIVLWLDRGELRVKAPKGVLNDDDVQSLKKHRAEIMVRLEMAIGTGAYERDLVPRPGREAVPLTFSQLAFWHGMKLATQRYVRQCVSATRLQGPCDLEALRESIAAVIHRQELLRTRIEVVDGTPQQRIVEWPDFVLEVDELPASVNGSRERETEQWIARHVAELMDVKKDPMFSIRVLKESDEQHVLLITVHHIVTDGASTNILLREVMTAYGQLCAGLPISLPAIPIQFLDYALWQQEQPWIAKRADYWSRRVAAYEPARFQRSAPSGRRGIAGAQVRIDRDMLAGLTAQARRQRTTVVMSVFAAYVALLTRWCRLPDIVVRFATDGRMSPRLENTVGCFTFWLYLCVSVADNPSLSELISRVATEYSMAQDYADFSYAEAHRTYGRVALASGFNWIPHGAAVVMPEDGPLDQSVKYAPVPFEHPQLGAGAIEFDQQWEPFVIVNDMKTEAEATIHYSPNLYSDDSMNSFARNLRSFLETLVTRPHTRIQDIPIS